MFGRLIFRFRDGLADRLADPQAAWSALDAALGGDWTDTFRLVASQPPPGCVGETLAGFLRGRDEAGRRLAEAVRSAFGVPPFEAGGLTLWELIVLAGAFLDYMAALKGLARPFSTPPGPASPSPAA